MHNSKHYSCNTRAHAKVANAIGICALVIILTFWAGLAFLVSIGAIVF